MASRKDTETYVEILERLLLLSKKGNLGSEYDDLISVLEDRFNKQFSENQSLREDLIADSEYIAKLQKELKLAKEHPKETRSDRGDIDRFEKELNESKFHAKQLEKGILYLRCKLDEANTDKELLNQELLQSREEIQTLRLQLEEARKSERKD